MSVFTNRIVALIIFLITIIGIIYIIKTTKKEKNILHTHTKKLNIILIILSFILFISSLIINLINIDEYSIKNIIDTIFNSISIGLIPLPITTSIIYYIFDCSKNEYYHIKTIISNEDIPKSLYNKLRKAHINLIIVSEKNPSLEIKELKKEQLNKNIIKTKSFFINSKDYNNILDLFSNKDEVIYSTNVSSTYKEIIDSRGNEDNYIRTIKYLISSYLPLILSVLLFWFTSFPFTSNLLLIVTIKVYTLITSLFVYKNMPFDTDIKLRYPKPSKVFIPSQELLLNVIQSFLVFFILTIPYMYILTLGGSEKFVTTIYLITFIYANIFLTYVNYSESSMLKNIFVSLKNIKLDIMVLVSIAFTIIINYIHIFNTTNIGIRNYFGCVLFAFIGTIIFDITKFARFITIRGDKKHETKNHKKHRRSKLNNS